MRKLGLLAIILLNCSLSLGEIRGIGYLEPDDAFFVQSPKKNQIHIVSYNLLNLYDTVHDEGFFDYTYLPLSHPEKQEKCLTLRGEYYKTLCQELDWIPSEFNKRLNEFKKAFRAHGPLPDILAVQEIENSNVGQQLAKKLGYKNFHITSQENRRGIDVGIFWQSKKLKFKSHYEVYSPLRNTLRSHFIMKKSKKSLYVYNGHWPAQSAPPSWRIEAAMAVRGDIDRVLSSDKEAHIIVLGDLNVKTSEYDQVFGTTLKDPSWTHKMEEIHDLSRKKYPNYLDKFPNGTYWSYWFQRWNHFDRFFVNKNLLSGKVKANIKSYRVLYTETLVKSTKFEIETIQYEVRTPQGYNFLKDPERPPQGFSDHLPISLLIDQ